MEAHDGNTGDRGEGVAYSASCGFALVDDTSLSAVCRRALNTLEELNSAKRDVEAGGEDRTPAVISLETRDASPPSPRTTRRARRRSSPPRRVGWMKEEDTRMMCGGGVYQGRGGEYRKARGGENANEEDNE